MKKYILSLAILGISQQLYSMDALIATLDASRKRSKGGLTAEDAIRLQRQNLQDLSVLKRPRPSSEENIDYGSFVAPDPQFKLPAGQLAQLKIRFAQNKVSPEEKVMLQQEQNVPDDEYVQLLKEKKRNGHPLSMREKLKIQMWDATQEAKKLDTQSYTQSEEDEDFY